jgi:hypothetical protein
MAKARPACKNLQTMLERLRCRLCCRLELEVETPNPHDTTLYISVRGFRPNMRRLTGSPQIRYQAYSSRIPVPVAYPDGRQTWHEQRELQVELAHVLADISMKMGLGLGIADWSRTAKG